jgi:hypothetical protein
MGGWVDGSKRGYMDCLQQSKFEVSLEKYLKNVGKLDSEVGVWGWG